MRKYICLLFLLSLTIQPGFSIEISKNFKFNNFFNSDTRAIKKLINSQVDYANKTDFKNFIATYDANYINADGFNLDSYSNLVRDIWNTYDKIEYDIDIKNISINNDTAVAELIETSYVNIPVSEKMDGILKSKANSVYHLKKINGNWKVISDSVLTETTSMLYGEAKNLDIKLSAPTQILANTEYTASLEFTPPEDAIVIASIANDKVEYPQAQTKEVFRKFPEENILERLFTSNSDNVNEYVVASIGLTRANVSDISIKLSLVGFGYHITRVNVIPQNKFIDNNTDSTKNSTMEVNAEVKKDNDKNK